MSKAVLISIRPKWCELIASGKKTIEVRKSQPKLETPFKCYIYCTKLHPGEPDSMINLKGKTSFFMPKGGAVIGEFVCDAIYEIINVGNAFKVGKTAAETNRVARASCLDFGDMHDYFGHKGGYGWHISKLKIYDQPKELSEFHSCSFCDYRGVCPDGSWCQPLKRPPQSWCYVEEEQ